MRGYEKSRAAAIQAGALNYCTDKPCKRGHRALRFTANGGCSECMRLANSRDFYRESGSDEMNPNLIEMEDQHGGH
jgi:hypothetical protein